MGLRWVLGGWTSDRAPRNLQQKGPEWPGREACAACLFRMSPFTVSWSVCLSVSSLLHWLVPKPAWLRPRHLPKQEENASPFLSFLIWHSWTLLAEWRGRMERGQPLEGAAQQQQLTGVIITVASTATQFSYFQHFLLKLWKQRS